MKAKSDHQKELNYEISEASPHTPLTSEEQGRRFVPALLCGIVKRTAGSVMNMPMLKEPEFDDEVLKENIFVKVVYAWVYMLRKFEYAVEPTRRGFAAWLRLIFAFMFYAVLPVLVLSALLLVCVYVVTNILVLSDLTVKILWNVVRGLCLVLSAIFLCYVIYAVIATLRRKPVKVPVPKFKFVKPSN